MPLLHPGKGPSYPQQGSSARRWAALECKDRGWGRGHRPVSYHRRQARPTPTAKDTRTPQKMTDSETPATETNRLGGGKRMAGPLGKETGNLWSTGGTQSWYKGDPRQTTLLPLIAGLPRPVEPLFIWY